MWLNDDKVTGSAIRAYRASLLGTCPHYVVIDGLFDDAKLDEVMTVLQQPYGWETQQHTYSALYVDRAQWQQSSLDERFVQRDAWSREAGLRDTGLCDLDGGNTNLPSVNKAHEFLSFLRSEAFLSVLSRIFNVRLTDMNVAEPDINSNFFRLGAADFVEQHADDSPGREVCMLLYLNKGWSHGAGGELVFSGKGDEQTSIAPVFNRCVLFDPFSEGSEHWVRKWHAECPDAYRYNVTSWYWSE